MTEQMRLLDYYPGFSEDVVETVAAIAEQQRAPENSWAKIQAKLPATKLYIPKNGKPIEVFDIVPKDYDEVYVYHMPMANPVASHMQLHLHTIAEAAPNKRIIGVGNPSGIRFDTGKLSLADSKSVWKGDLRPTVDTTFQYLSSQGIKQVVHIGFSFGAEKTATAISVAHEYDQEVSKAILMEPVTLKDRYFWGLARKFFSTLPGIEHYLKVADSRPLNEAMKEYAKANFGGPGYILGLARPTNLAIAKALTYPTLENRIRQGLDTQQNMDIVMIWGGASELTVNDLMGQLVTRLTSDYGPERVASMMLEGQKHGMGDDIFLHTALVLQALHHARTLEVAA